MPRPTKVIGPGDRALDILALPLDLQSGLGLTHFFVAHDLSAVKHIGERVMVIYVGRIAEVASTHELLGTSKPPYTEMLRSAVPKPDPRLRSQRIVLEGSVADPANPVSSCYFHPRCRHAVDICQAETPQLQEIVPKHCVSCHRAHELSLGGVVVT
jgi:peptide/nickel transport system ATP-binding protein